MQTLDPEVEALLKLIRSAGRPPFEALTPEDARNAYAATKSAPRRRRGRHLATRYQGSDIAASGININERSTKHDHRTLAVTNGPASFDGQL